MMIWRRVLTAPRLLDLSNILWGIFDFLKSVFVELVSKTSYMYPDILLICIIDFLLQLNS